MSWSDDLDLGNGLDDIGINSVHQRDTLTSTNLVWLRITKLAT